MQAIMHEPRVLRGRHRTTTLIFPSPASAMSMDFQQLKAVAGLYRQALAEREQYKDGVKEQNL